MMDHLKIQIENERRWNIKCQSILLFHTLMEETREGIRGNKWRIEDTALELGLSTGFISESLKLARALDKNDKLKYFSRENALNYLREE